MPPTLPGTWTPGAPPGESWVERPGEGPDDKGSFLRSRSGMRGRVAPGDRDRAVALALPTSGQPPQRPGNPCGSAGALAPPSAGYDSPGPLHPFGRTHGADSSLGALGLECRPGPGP